MKPIHAAYTQEVYANLRPLHATWEPTQPVELGDIGVLQGRAFRQQTDLKSLGVKFSERRGGARANLFFGSHGTTDMQLKPELAAGSRGVSQRASIELTFTSKGAVFFHAAQCESIIIADKEALRRAVLDQFARGRWEPAWVVITEIVRAGATTIAIAGQKGAKLRLEAQSSEPTLDLADASVRFQLRSVSRVDYQLISGDGLAPLIGLSKLQRPWFRRPDFGPGLTESAEVDDSWDFLEIS